MKGQLDKGQFVHAPKSYGEWHGYYRIVSVNDHASLICVQEVEGDRKGLIRWEGLKRVVPSYRVDLPKHKFGWEASRCRRHIEQIAEGREIDTIWVDWRPYADVGCGCGENCKSEISSKASAPEEIAAISESELNKQMTLF